MLWKQTQAKRDRFMKLLSREWKAALLRQLEPVLNEIDESTINTIAARVPQLMTEEEIAKMMLRTVEMVGPYFAANTLRDVSKAAQDNRILKQDIPTDDEWIARINSILGMEAGARITAITGSSKEEAVKIIKAVLQQGAEEGLGIPQLSRLLRDQLNEQWGKISTYRAARIARTEVVSASNLGSLMGAEQSGVPLMKVWLSTRDSRTRRDTAGGRYKPGPFDHYGKFPAGPDGEMVGLKEKFVKTGESLNHPGDPAGSAGNTINCRCTQYFEPIETDII